MRHRIQNVNFQNISRIQIQQTCQEPLQGFLIPGKDLEKQQMKTAIRDLQKEVIRQGQMIEF